MDRIFSRIFLLSVWFDHIKLRLIPDVVDVKIKDSDKISVSCLSTIKVTAENSRHSSCRLPQLSPPTTYYSLGRPQPSLFGLVAGGGGDGGGGGGCGIA